MSSGDEVGFPRGVQGRRRGQGAGDAGEDPALASSRAAERRDAARSRRSTAATSRSSIALVEAGAPLDLFTAAALGRADVVDDAASQEDPDQRRVSSRTTAGRRSTSPPSSGTPTVVTLLLERGAPISTRSPPTAMRNTPLHAAVAGGRVDAALTLIEAGAEVNAAGRRRPHAAAHRRRGWIRADCRGAAAAQGRPARRGCRGSDAAGPRRRAESRGGDRSDHAERVRRGSSRPSEAGCHELRTAESPARVRRELHRRQVLEHDVPLPALGRVRRLQPVRGRDRPRERRASSGRA